MPIDVPNSTIRFARDRQRHMRALYHACKQWWRRFGEKRDAMAEQKPDPNRAYYDKTISALTDLFDKAKAANELHFVMALMAEFRGMQDGGWNTAEEAIRAFDQLYAHIDTIAKEDPVRVRVIMGLYLHVAEGSGFYEIPKKLMLTIEGKGNNIWPFQDLVEKHIQTGTIIDPNANRIMKNMMGHAQEARSASGGRR
jgi:hypothetical protein